MLAEFKKFAMRGNVVDMAVGIILGAAFGKIVASAVKDVLMPPIGMILGNVEFEHLTFPLQDAKPEEVDAAGVVTAEAADAVEIRYGLFITSVIDFIIIAFVIFMVIKGMNSLKKAEPEPEATEKKCDHCKTTIPIDATRCPHCTSELEKAA